MQKIIWAKHTLIVLTCVHCYLINLFLNILSHIPLLFFSFQVVMVLASKGDHALNGLYTRINTRHILETSKMVFNLNPFLYFIFSLSSFYLPLFFSNFHNFYQQVEEYSGMHLQPHKPLVGANAFVHASGIHQVSRILYMLCVAI